MNAKSKVTIAFDDPLVGYIPGHPKPCFIGVAVKVVMEELDKLGVDPHNIRLLCAIGLHSKPTTRELACLLGEDLAYRSGPSKLLVHDAMDKDNLVFLGETERYQEVDVHHLVMDSDHLVYVSMPPTTYNGGWKSVIFGLTGWRCIRHHHRPYPWNVGESRLDPKSTDFLKMLNEMGALIEKELAKKGSRIIQIEGTLNNTIPPDIVQGCGSLGI